MLTDTQIDSWIKLQHSLGKRQSDVYSVIVSRGGATTLEICQVLHMPMHCISGRVTELQDQGLVRDKGKRAYNPVTHRKVVVWEPIGP